MASLRILALHGVPTGPRLWERLSLPAGWEVDAPFLPGLGHENTPDDWSLEGAVERLRERAEHAHLLVGHDLGGVLAAMLARPGQRLVLTGTALGPYWAATRLSARPVLWRFFYKQHAGRLFLRRGALPEHADDLLEAFSDHGDEWPMRMRRVARAMRPPPGLAAGLRKRNPVLLIWGRKDPWYPRPVVQAVARSTGGALHYVDSGHFAPWEAPGAFSKLLRSFGAL